METCACFADELEALHQRYQDEETRNAWRTEMEQQAIDHFLSGTLGNDTTWDTFVGRATSCVKSFNTRTLCFLSWHGRGPEYNGHYLSDLLDKATGNSLLERLQNELDLRGGKNRFVIFRTTNDDGQHALMISWDSKIIKSEREKTQSGTKHYDRDRFVVRDKPGPDMRRDGPGPRGPPRKGPRDGPNPGPEPRRDGPGPRELRDPLRNGPRDGPKPGPEPRRDGPKPGPEPRRHHDPPNVSSPVQTWQARPAKPQNTRPPEGM